MPQYQGFQYGMKQYGLFLPSKTGSEAYNLNFIKSRFGIYLNGQVFYLYQHEPIALPGRPRKMRLSTNTGETVYKEEESIRGQAPLLRIKSNLSNEWIVSNEH